MIIVATPPSERDQRFTGMLIRFFNRHYCDHHQNPSAAAAYLARLQELFTIWNGFRQGRVVHHCQPSVCGCRGRDHTFARLTVSLQRLMVHAAPVTPSLGKWTQLAECLQWLCMFGLMNIGPLLFDDALDPKHFGKHAEAAAHVSLEHHLEGFLHDTNWHGLSGKRYQLSAARLRDPNFLVSCFTLAVVIEPIRTLHSFFLDLSMSEVHIRKIGWPAAISLVNDRESIVVQVLQYWSAMLASPQDVPRVELLWRARDCASFREWARTHPADVRRLSGAVLQISAAVEHRIHRYVHRALGVFAITDLRNSQEHRVRIAEQLAVARSCCLDHGFARGFVAWARQAAFGSSSASSAAAATAGNGPAAGTASSSTEQIALIAGSATGSASAAVACIGTDTKQIAATMLGASEILFNVAHFLKLSIACVEREHNHNKQLARSGRSTHAQVAASSVLNHVWGRFRRWSQEQLNLRDAAEQDARDLVKKTALADHEDLVGSWELRFPGDLLGDDRVLSRFGVLSLIP